MTFERFPLSADSVFAEAFYPDNFHGYILHFHGGGRTAPLNNFYRKIALRLARLTRAAVISVDYPTGQYVYPAMHDYCFSAYSTFAKQFPMEQTILLGDSYGANLALSCMLRARDNALPLPAACVCISPFADMSASGDSYLENCRRDPVYGLTVFQSKKHADKLRRISAYCGDTPLKTPYLSPCFGDYTGFPPLLIQTGGAETSASDAYFIVSAAEKANVPCRLHVFQGMWHDFQYIIPFLKESKAAWAEIAAFCREMLYTPHDKKINAELFPPISRLKYSAIPNSPDSEIPPAFDNRDGRRPNLLIAAGNLPPLFYKPFFNCCQNQNFVLIYSSKCVPVW